MVGKGIDWLDLMLQEDFCPEVSGKFSQQIPFPGHYPCDQLTKDPNYGFPTIVTDLDTSNA